MGIHNIVITTMVGNSLLDSNLHYCVGFDIFYRHLFLWDTEGAADTNLQFHTKEEKPQGDRKIYNMTEDCILITNQSR